MARNGVRVLGVAGALAAAALALLARRRNGGPAQTTPTPAPGAEEPLPPAAAQASPSPTGALGPQGISTAGRRLPLEVVAVVASGTLIGVGAAVFYFFGLFYADQYYGAIGLDSDALDLPTHQYIANGGFVAFVATAIYAPLLLLRWESQTVRRTYLAEAIAAAIGGWPWRGFRTWAG